MKKKPIVLILDTWGSIRDTLHNAGAETVSIDDYDDLRFEAVIDDIDALVLTGGGDINPARYGDERHPTVSGVDKLRDDFEFKAVRVARDKSIPILGICRGHQVLNVAFGGSLVQNVGDLGQHITTHGIGSHDILLRRKSRLARALGTVTLSQMTTLHHQAIDRLGKGLVPVGWSEDGIIEAVESLPGTTPYILGTQFHPEIDAQYTIDRHALGIFRHFVSQARPRRDESRRDYRNRLAGIRGVTYKRPVYSWPNTTWAGNYDGLGNADYIEDEVYEAWLEEHTEIVTETSIQAKQDARCGFPPCKCPADCDVNDGCYAIAVATQEAKSELTTSIKTMHRIDGAKRGNRRSHSKGYVNQKQRGGRR